MLGSSQINSQAATVQQILVPQGVGLKNNTSPSLPATTGSLAVDVSSTGQLLMGSAGTWTVVASQTGFTGSSALMASGNFFTSAGSNPHLAMANATFQLITLSGQSMVLFDINCNSSSAGAVLPDTFTLNTTIPAAFIPKVSKQFPIQITDNTTPNGANAILTLSTGGVFAIVISNSATTNLNVLNMSGVYSLNN